MTGVRRSRCSTCQVRLRRPVRGRGPLEEGTSCVAARPWRFCVPGLRPELSIGWHVPDLRLALLAGPTGLLSLDAGLVANLRSSFSPLPDTRFDLGAQRLPKSLTRSCTGCCDQKIDDCRQLQRIAMLTTSNSVAKSKLSGIATCELQMKSMPQRG